MIFERHIINIGESTGIVLPKDLVKHLNIKSGDKINITQHENKIIIEKVN
jgi:AbrB family looped-hinge helix DNA binding protein